MDAIEGQRETDHRGAENAGGWNAQGRGLFQSRGGFCRLLHLQGDGWRA